MGRHHSQVHFNQPAQRITPLAWGCPAARPRSRDWRSHAPTEGVPGLGCPRWPRWLPAAAPAAPCGQWQGQGGGAGAGGADPAVPCCHAGEFGAARSCCAGCKQAKPHHPARKGCSEKASLELCYDLIEAGAGGRVLCPTPAAARAAEGTRGEHGRTGTRAGRLARQWPAAAQLLPHPSATPRRCCTLLHLSSMPALPLHQVQVLLQTLECRGVRPRQLVARGHLGAAAPQHQRHQLPGAQVAGGPGQPPRQELPQHDAARTAWGGAGARAWAAAQGCGVQAGRDRCLPLAIPVCYPLQAHPNE